MDLASMSKTSKKTVTCFIHVYKFRKKFFFIKRVFNVFIIFLLKLITSLQHNLK